jgi:hypothetical protein
VEPGCVIYLVGNQVDKVEGNPALRQVAKDRAAAFAHEKGMVFDETSALTNIKVNDTFDHLMHCKENILK